MVGRGEREGECEKKEEGKTFFPLFEGASRARKRGEESAAAAAAAAAASRASFSSSSSSTLGKAEGDKQEKQRRKRAKTQRAGKAGGKKTEEEKKLSSHLGVVDEVRDGRGQEVGLGLEVGVEDRDVVVVRQLLEPLLERAGLVPGAVGPAQRVAVDAALAPLGDLVVDEVARRLVGRVVEDLERERVLGSGFFCVCGEDFRFFLGLVSAGSGAFERRERKKSRKREGEEKEREREKREKSNPFLLLFFYPRGLSRNREKKKIDGNEGDVQSSKSAPVGPSATKLPPFVLCSPLSRCASTFSTLRRSLERKRLTTRPGTAQKKRHQK